MRSLYFIMDADILTWLGKLGTLYEKRIFKVIQNQNTKKM